MRPTSVQEQNQNIANLNKPKTGGLQALKDANPGIDFDDPNWNSIEEPAQRVLSPQEYSDLGYTLRDDYDNTLIQTGGYNTPSSFDINFLGFPVYRADTKEQYYVDAGTAIFKVTASVYTGGLSAGGAQALSQLGQLLG